MKYYYIRFHDGTFIKARGFNWLAGEHYMIVLSNYDIVEKEDRWGYFTKDTTKLYIPIYTIHRIEEREEEEKK